MDEDVSSHADQDDLQDQEEDQDQDQQLTERPTKKKKVSYFPPP